MGQKMLYRLSGDPEKGIIKTIIEGTPVEAKIFARGEKPEGWFSAARIAEFMADEPVKPEPAASISIDTLKPAIYAEIDCMEEKDAKLAIDQWAESKGIKLDRRKSLDKMKADLEEALNANGE